MRRCPCTVRRIHYHILWLCYEDTPSLKMLSHLPDTPPRVSMWIRKMLVMVSARVRDTCIKGWERAHHLPLFFAKDAILQTRKELWWRVGTTALGVSFFLVTLTFYNSAGASFFLVTLTFYNSTGCFLLSGYSDVLQQHWVLPSFWLL